MGDDVMVLGGMKHNELGWLPSGHCYVMYSGHTAWDTLPDMLYPVSWGLTLNVGRSVIVFGGWGADNKLTKHVQMLDLDTMQWSRGTQLPENCDAVYNGGVVYKGL